MQFQAFDGEYLERLRAGDFRTEEHFVSYFSQLIQLKLRSRLNSREAIEDVRQEIFARVFATLRSEKGLRQADRLGPFVNSVCNNVLLEHYRSSSRHAPPDEDDGTGRHSRLAIRRSGRGHEDDRPPRSSATFSTI